MFDYISATLTCPYRGGVTDASELDLQTHMAARPHQNVYRVGDEIELDPGLAGYYPVGARPIDPGDLAILEEWSCTCCGAWRWARIRVRDGRIESVEAVPLTEKVLAESDYISGAVEVLLPGPEVFEWFDGLTPAEKRRELVRLQEDVERHRDDPVT